MTGIIWALVGMVGLSSGLTVLKNVAANNRIERTKNCTIKEDERSVSEIIISDVKDYAYLFLPFYNVYKSIALIVKNDATYAEEKYNILVERERISTKTSRRSETPKPNKADKTEAQGSKKSSYPQPGLKPIKKDEPKPELKMEPETEEKQSEKKTVRKIEEMTLEEQVEYYYNLDKELHAKYDALKAANAKQSDLDELIEVDEEVQKRYISLSRELRKQTLIAERDKINSELKKIRYSERTLK